MPESLPASPKKTTPSAPTITTQSSSLATAQRYRYQSEIQSMMYTFGDIKNPLPATTMLVEDIVHSQILEMVPFIQYLFMLKFVVDEGDGGGL